MAETTDLPSPSHQLETHRFTPSRESMRIMQTLRNDLPTTQEEIPELRGITYFGSRTVGREHTDPDNPSDQDIVVFYDGSRFIPQQKAFLMEKGRLVVNKLAKQEGTELKQARIDLMNRIEASYTTQLQSLSLPVEFHGEHNATIQIVDISQPATDKTISDFMNEVNVATNFGKNPLEITSVTPNTFTLLSRFYLGVGEGLYQNRDYILNKFAGTPNGELYFSALMSYLNYHERTKTTEKREGLPPARLPSTIDEGRKYFVTSPVL